MRHLFVLLAIARFASACSCTDWVYGPICQRIDKVEVLFIGTAIQTNSNQYGTWYRFSVDERFKGVDPATKELFVDPGMGTSCQEKYSVGKRYLVSSYTLPQTWAPPLGGFPLMPGASWPLGPTVLTGVCSGKRLVEYAAEDIRYARQYKSGATEPRIFGFVGIHALESPRSDRSYPPLVNAVVRMHGPGGSHVSTTNADGRFEVPKVARGSYTVTAESAGFRSQRPFYTVEVPPSGCGVANIGMFSDGEIRGVVLEQDGTPARNVPVEYVYRSRAYVNADRSTRTNTQGRFRFSRVPPGEFFLGVHIDTPPEVAEKIAPTYWPGVANEKMAGILRFAVNEKRNGLTIQLGPRASVRKIRVRVRWPNGRPAAEASVEASVNGAVAEFGKTNLAGMVTLSVLNGVEYVWEARIWNGDAWIDTGSQTLPASSSAVQLLLTLRQRAK